MGSLNFWKIIAFTLVLAILLATAHMEYKSYHQQVEDPRHYETIGN